MMKKPKIKISDSLVNITKMSSGTMLGQVVSFIAVPIYTRMYGASILGIAAIVNSIVAVVTSFSDLGLKNAIMIEDDEKTESIYTIISTITAITAVIVGLLSVAYYTFIDTSIGLNPVYMGLLIGINVFLSPQTQTCYTWLNKMGHYDVLMKNPVIHNLAMALVTIGLGVLGFKEYGYFIGMLVGTIITIIRMKFYLPRKMFNFKIEDYLYVFRTKKEFYLYQMPTNVLAQFKEQVPVFAIQTFFGVEVLGYYSITLKYLGLPINLLGQSIGRVFFKNVAEMTRKAQDIGEYAFKNVSRAMMLAAIPLIAIYSAGDIACVLLFGDEYIVAGNIMRIIASNSFLNFLMVSCNGMTVVLHRQKASMVTSICQMVGYALGITAGYVFTRDIYLSCLLMTIIYAIVQGTFFGYLFHCANIDWKRYAIKLVQTLAVTFGCSFVLRGILFIIGIVPAM